MHENPQLALARIIEELARGEGFLPSPVPGVRLMRSTRYLSQRPMIYEPCLVFLAQGRKRAVFSDRVIHYDPGHFLAMTVPLPFESETFGTPDAPLLGVAVRLDPLLVADLVTMMEVAASVHNEAATVTEAFPVDAEMEDAVNRLLRALRAPDTARILAPLAIREIVYLALRGPAGCNLRELVPSSGLRTRIAEIAHRLNTRPAERHIVADLAAEVGMSTSSFHAHFKLLTQFTPIQYLKRVRLHRARLTMINSDVGVAKAAELVGYESSSHFTRDFKTLFGDPPATVVRRARAALVGSGQTELRGILTFTDPPGETR